MPRINTPEILLQRVNRSGPIPEHRPDLGPCWLWTGKLGKWGYAKARVFYRTRVVHRVIYEHFNGLVPDGLELDHLCRNRACCNPEHLEPVTGRENKLRGTSFSAVNAKKTHCLRGHPLSGDNLYVSTKGERVCRTCRRAAIKAWHQREAIKKRESISMFPEVS